MKFKSILLFCVFLLVVTPSVLAKDFVIHNSTDETQNYFVVNGTTGNTNVTGTGLFGWLGSSSEEIGKLWVDRIVATTNISTPKLCLSGACQTSWGDVVSGEGGWNDTGSVVDLVYTARNVSAGAFFVDNTNSRVGIGTTTPAAKLDVNGTIYANKIAGASSTMSSFTPSINAAMAGQWSLDLSTWVGALGQGGTGDIKFSPLGTRRMTILSGGNVGIGTAAPASSLDVNGTITGRDGAKFYSDEAGETDVRFTINTDVANLTRMYNLNESGASFNSVQFGGNPSLNNGITVTADGYSGINVTDPTSLLQLSNDGWISAKNAAGDGTINMFKVNSENQIEVGATLNIGTFEFAADSGLVTFADMPVTSDASIGTPESYVFKIDGDNIMSIYSESDGAGGVQNKRVGIGTVSPQNTLNVIGDLNATTNISAPMFCLDGDCQSSWGGAVAGAGGWNLTNDVVGLVDSDDNVSAGTFFVDNANSRVGIGTITPRKALDVVGQAVISGESVIGTYETPLATLLLSSDLNAPDDLGDYDNYQLVLKGGISTGDSAGMLFSTQTNAYGGSAIVHYDTDSGGKGDLAFYTKQGTTAVASPIEVMRLDDEGNVGIGTTSPQQKLDVAGNININSSTAAYMYDGSVALKLAKGTDPYYSNTFVGSAAGNSTAYRQTAIGNSAGYLNKGSYQSTLGFYSGYNNTGDYQTAIGYHAGYQNTGTYTTVVGYFAGKENSGTSQTAFGNYAGYQNTGARQAVLGQSAGQENTGNYLTALGYAAGYKNTGDRVTSLGYYASQNNTGDNVVAIGYEAGKDNTDDNQFIVQHGDTTPLIQGNFSSGNVGIGTTTPNAKLEVTGDVIIDLTD